jgi:hypothetical protein
MQKIFPKNNQYSRKDAVIVEWPYDLTGLVSKLQKIDFPLANIGDIVTACICLHNLCIILHSRSGLHVLSGCCDIFCYKCGMVPPLVKIIIEFAQINSVS